MNECGRAGLLSIFATLALGGCATTVPHAASGLSASGLAPSVTTALPPEAPPTGILLVYSATYAPTADQSEYPVHTDYTIATQDDRVIEHVSNLSGPFNAFPARVTLSPGRYRIRAQYDGGKFVDFPVDIEPDRTTTVNLNTGISQPGTDPAREPIRLPGGRIVGWCTTVSPRTIRAP